MKPKSTFFAIFFFLFLSSPSKAQPLETVQGQITRESDGSPWGEIEIIIESQERAFFVSVLTDSMGQFNVSVPPGSYQIRVLGGQKESETRLGDFSIGENIDPVEVSLSTGEKMEDVSIRIWDIRIPKRSPWLLATCGFFIAFSLLHFLIYLIEERTARPFKNLDIEEKNHINAVYGVFNMYCAVLVGMHYGENDSNFFSFYFPLLSLLCSVFICMLLARIFFPESKFLNPWNLSKNLNLNYRWEGKFHPVFLYWVVSSFEVLVLLFIIKSSKEMEGFGFFKPLTVLHFFTYLLYTFLYFKTETILKGNSLKENLQMILAMLSRPWFFYAQLFIMIIILLADFLPWFSLFFIISLLCISFSAIYSNKRFSRIIGFGCLVLGITFIYHIAPLVMDSRVNVTS